MGPGDDLGADLFCGLGKQFPFCLLHDAKLQLFRGVSRIHPHSLLGDDLAAVGDLVHVMYRGAAHFNALGQCRLVDLQSVEAFAAETGDEGGVDIDDALFVVPGKALAEDGEPASQHDEVGLRFVQQTDELLFEGFLAAAVLAGHGNGFDPGILRTLEAVGPFAVGDDELNSAAVQRACLFRIQDGLQVGAAAADEHGDIRLLFFLSGQRCSLLLPGT